MVPLTSCLTGLESAVCFYLQNRLIQTSQTGGQQYSDTFPFSIPCSEIFGGNFFSPNDVRNRRLLDRGRLVHLPGGRVEQVRLLDVLAVPQVQLVPARDVVDHALNRGSVLVLARV